MNWIFLSIVGVAQRRSLSLSLSLSLCVCVCVCLCVYRLYIAHQAPNIGEAVNLHMTLPCRILPPEVIPVHGARGTSQRTLWALAQILKSQCPSISTMKTHCIEDFFFKNRGLCGVINVAWNALLRAYTRPDHLKTIELRRRLECIYAHTHTHTHVCVCV